MHVKTYGAMPVDNIVGYWIRNPVDMKGVIRIGLYYVREKFENHYLLSTEPNSGSADLAVMLKEPVRTMRIRPTTEMLDQEVPYTITPEDGSLEAAEKASILRAIKLTNENMAQAAKILKIGRATLYRKLKKYEINYRAQLGSDQDH